MFYTYESYYCGFPKETYADGRYIPKRSMKIKNKRRNKRRKKEGRRTQKRKGK